MRFGSLVINNQIDRYRQHALTHTHTHKLEQDNLIKVLRKLI